MTLDLRSYRRINGIKQRDLADLLGLSLNQLMRFERGFSDLPKDILDQLQQIGAAQSLDVVLKAREVGEGYVTSKPTNGLFIDRTSQVDPSKLHVVDLFCGVGGLSHGFERTGRFQVTTGVDLLSDRLSTFVANHPAAVAHGEDIRNLSVDRIEDSGTRPFVVVGGPPCQGFSSLRPFRNVEKSDPRNNLGEEFVRVVAGLQPEWVVFENVVGLLTHGKGKMLEQIQGAFEEIGYRTSARVLNGAHFGLPQKRERLVIIGSRKGKSVDWPKATHHFSHKSMAGRPDLIIQPEMGLFGNDLEDAVTFQDATNDLPILASGENSVSYRHDVGLSKYESLMRIGSDKLTLHDATKHSEKMLNIIRHAGANISALPEGMVTSGFSSCYSRLAYDEPSTTITVNFVHPASNRCIHPEQDRALTPREGARLQSFEDTFTFSGTRSKIVKQIGNAVPPLLGQIVAETLLRSD